MLGSRIVMRVGRIGSLCLELTKRVRYRVEYFGSQTIQSLTSAVVVSPLLYVRSDLQINIREEMVAPEQSLVYFRRFANPEQGRFTE